MACRYLHSKYPKTCIVLELALLWFSQSFVASTENDDLIKEPKEKISVKELQSLFCIEVEDVQEAFSRLKKRTASAIGTPKVDQIFMLIHFLLVTNLGVYIIARINCNYLCLVMHSCDVFLKGCLGYIDMFVTMPFNAATP